jgi:hypothetical protein
MLFLGLINNYDKVKFILMHSMRILRSVIMFV